MKTHAYRSDPTAWFGQAALCVKHDQQEARASVLAPSIETPVPAFQKDALPEGVLREVLTDAGAALDEVVRTCLPWAPMRGNELLSDLRTRRESP